MADKTLSPPALPARPLARPSSRRSLRSLSSNHDDPLSSSPASPTPALAVASPSNGDSAKSPSSPSHSAASSNGAYAVYSGSSTKRRTSFNPLAATADPASTPGATSPAPSTIPTPPFHPTIALAPPPLVSRPSNSTLPSPSGRSYARSVSEAKEQLQKQALKAQLQGLGLAIESWGAAIVHRLVGLGEEGDGKAIHSVLKSGKITLLLPSEKVDTSISSITMPILLDHLALVSAPLSSSDTRTLTTLSGLRGHVSPSEIWFDDCGLAVRAAEQGLVRKSTVEPLVDYANEDLHRYLRGPLSSAASSPSSSKFPTFSILPAHLTLSLPRSTSASAATAASSSRTNTSSRLAALFSKSPSATPDPATPTDAASPLSNTAPSTPADTSAQGSKPAPNLDLPVLVVSSPIRFVELSKAVATAINSELRAALAEVDGIKGDPDALDRLVAFSTRLLPPPSASWTSVYPPPKALLTTTSLSSTSLFDVDIETISEAFQDLIHTTRLDLSRNLSVGSPTTAAAARPSPGLEDFGVLEEHVNVTLSQVEDILLSTVLYSHVFSPPTTSDSQDDENLASRIAALNVLELNLEHLGVDLTAVEEGSDAWADEKRGVRETVEDLADLVGKELARLEDPADRTTSSKLDVFVQAHKILVDELAKLPPLPLKKEIGPSSSATSSSSDLHSNEVEMDDASSRASSRAPSRPRSPTPVAEVLERTDDDLLRTPRPPPAGDQDVPEIHLPDSSSFSPKVPPTMDVTSSMHEATTSTFFEPTIPATSPPPPSVFDSSARHRAPSITSSLRSPQPTSSADLILPFLIYSVVRSNPPRLTSHLRFAHRFRSESLMRGQASYCLTNFDAVVEFLNHVDVSSLGLSSQKVFAATSGSTSTPPPSLAPNATRPRAYTTGRLSSRVSTELPGLIDSANSALSGVVDSSYRMLFGPTGLSAAIGGSAPKSLEDVRGVLEGAAAKGRPRIGLPFRRSASVVTLPGDSRSGSGVVRGQGIEEERLEDLAGSTGTLDAKAGPQEGKSVPPGGPHDDGEANPSARPASPVQSIASGTEAPSPQKKEDDTRSIRSISSLIRDTTLGRTLGDLGSAAVGGGAPTATGGVAVGPDGTTGDRPSFGERLSYIPGLGRFGSVGAAAGATGGEAKASGANGPSGSTRASIFSAFSHPANASGSSPTSSRRSTLLNPPISTSTLTAPSTHDDATTPTSTTVARPLSSSGVTFEPIRRFLEVESADELKVGDVRTLLDSYRQLVAVWESERTL
ncbi:hypothetical protein JCM10212_001963 [Sporobolomyces blumeae]